MNLEPGSRIALCAGMRTPFVKAISELRNVPPLDLATHAVEGLLERLGGDPGVEALSLGVVVVDPRVPHLAREVVFRSGLSHSVRALTLVDNCITGTSAIENICDGIRAGRLELGIAAGVESMSNPAVMFTPRASRVFVDLSAARSLGERLELLTRLRPRDVLPDAPAIAEPSTGLTMGEHCELMVKEWGISRGEQDAIALRSHQRAHAATEDGRLRAEIYPLQSIDRDLLIRSGTTLEKLARLKPVFDRSETGTITAGTSSPLTDGAAAMLLASERRLDGLGLEPLAFVRDIEFAAIDPAAGLLMGPAVAVPRLLRRAGLTLSEIDLVEIHEAFAGQVACNLRAWTIGWREPAIGEVPEHKLNTLGSSIAVGHPFAATGIRIATTLANEMKRKHLKYGLVSICGAGATASAMLLEGI